MALSITRSVGIGGRNRPVDAAKVQHLLNANLVFLSRALPLQISGTVAVATKWAIVEFQTNAIGVRDPDGRVDPRGRTLRHLNRHAGRIGMPPIFTSGGVYDVLAAVSLQRFVALYEDQYGSLAAERRQGLERVTRAVLDDMEVWDVRWAAYMLATVKVECANRWQPIREFSRGRGRTYGEAVAFRDESGTSHRHAYYGRGYVQITWLDNYRRLGAQLGLGDRLAANPDLALDHDTAYRILSHGMRNGSFTRRKLSDYIDGARCDYVGARNIVNPGASQEKKRKMAHYALTIERLLRLSTVAVWLEWVPPAIQRQIEALVRASR